MFSNNPYNITLFKNGRRRWIFDGRGSSFDTDDQAGGLVPYAGFQNGTPDQMGAFGDSELLHIDFMCRLLLIGLGFFISFDYILTEMFKIVIRTDYYQFVKWIEAFFSSGYINPLFSSNNCHDVYITFLSEVEFF